MSGCALLALHHDAHLLHHFRVGKIARPRHVWIVPDMPKTRSGKIMRRVLAAISNGSPVGDITTLANPEVVEQVRIMVQGK